MIPRGTARLARARFAALTFRGFVDKFADVVDHAVGGSVRRRNPVCLCIVEAVVVVATLANGLSAGANGVGITALQLGNLEAAKRLAAQLSKARAVQVLMPAAAVVLDYRLESVFRERSSW